MIAFELELFGRWMIAFELEQPKDEGGERFHGNLPS